MSPENLSFNAACEAAQVLAGHFALRPWFDMATDRGDLRRKVRDKGFDPNEPMKDDCIDAAQEAVARHAAYLAAHAPKDPTQ